MQFSESWLRQFVNPSLTTDELSHALTMAGLEVEETRPLAPPFNSVVIAEILEAAQHPDADRLRVCKVSVGALSPEPLQIVCGAPNARVGIKIPCAMVGANLPPAEAGGKPFAIKVGKLRGVESYGMLCSGKEIGLGDDHAGIYELPADAPVGTDIREYLGLDDTIFTIKLTPNKADCLSVLGVAREVAAITGAELTLPKAADVKETIADRVAVKVIDKDLCGRFAGRVIRGVNAKVKTPDWMVRRLESAGQRSVSALVDISNYVMLEMGQPTHVFDLAKLKGDLTVRWGKPEETLKLLNGQTVELSSINLKVGVIADEQGLESLAGIMGGDHTAVTLDTTDIYVEAAFWWPAAIQGRARALNFSTDAGYRFERGVDPESAVKHLNYLVSLLTQICGGQVGPLDDQTLAIPKNDPVELRLARAEKIIGIALDGNLVAEYFDRLGFGHTRKNPGTPQESFIVQAPSHRFDVQIEEDLIEEIARLHGFENIPDIPPVARQRMQRTNETKRSSHAARHALAAQDYQEVVNYGFVDEDSEKQIAGNTDAIRVRNPLASQLAVMRSSLMGGLLANLRTNLNRKANRVRLFEVGRVFIKDVSVKEGELSIQGISQPIRIGGLAYGLQNPEQWGQKSRPVDFFDVKGDLEAFLAPLKLVTEATQHPALHPGRSAKLQIQAENGKVIDIGVMGELHPKWQQSYEMPLAPILFEIDWNAIENLPLPKIAEISKFPAVGRDLAVVLKQNVTAQSVLSAMNSVKAAIVKEIVLFDEFKPTLERAGGMQPDEKSLAFRITLSDETQTLQDAQVEAAVSQLLEKITIQFGARLR